MPYFIVCLFYRVSETYLKNVIYVLSLKKIPAQSSVIYNGNDLVVMTLTIKHCVFLRWRERRLKQVKSLADRRPWRLCLPRLINLSTWHVCQEANKHNVPPRNTNADADSLFGHLSSHWFPCRPWEAKMDGVTHVSGRVVPRPEGPFPSSPTTPY